jgi:hypothetical protein
LASAISLLVSPLIADNHHDYLVPLRSGTWPLASDILDALGRTDRGAAVFLNNQRHEIIRLNVPGMAP